MKIVFRVDSSSQIGYGHLMRCLVLAQRFHKLPGIKICFVVRNLPGNINSIIIDRGFKLLVLPKHEMAIEELSGYEKWLTVPQSVDAEDTRKALKKIRDVKLLVVDSYAISAEWENKVRPEVNKIMVIDDLANRRHECDFILDQSYGGEKMYRYNTLVPVCCKLFLGVSYVLLHESYYWQHPKVRAGMRHVLVFFGGSDDTGETLKFLQALYSDTWQNLRFTVIVGDSNQNKKIIERICNKFSNVTFYCQVDNMAELLANADIAFGAAGSNMWERCFLGLPAVVTVTGENQRFIAEQVNHTRAIRLLGWHESVYAGTYEKALLQIDKLPLETMSKAAFSVIGPSRVDEMVETILEDLQ